MMALARSVFLLIVLIAATGWLLSFHFESAADRRALVVSGLLALGVQLAAFGIVRWSGRNNALVRWGMGAILRSTILVFYGLFLARMLGLPLTAALTSFAVFLFASMMIESLLLAYES